MDDRIIYAVLVIFWLISSHRNNINKFPLKLKVRNHTTVLVKLWPNCRKAKQITQATRMKLNNR